MLRPFLLLLLLSTLLFSASVQYELDGAKKNLYSSSKEKQFKAYDTYKRHYLKALINGDVKTQKRCLDGICIAGNKLRIDVSDYKKKLSEIELKNRSQQNAINDSTLILMPLFMKSLL
jgi:hypothetical protein